MTSQQNDWVKSRIASGDYTNDSEYFRDLVRQDQLRNSQLERIRAALIEGEESGISPRTPQEIREQLREKLAEDGVLQAERTR